MNDAWIDYTGADVGWIDAHGLKPLHDPDRYGDVVRRWMSVKDAGLPAEMVFPLLGKDGRFRLFMTRVTPLRDHRGRISHWFGTNTDISAQSETEARLRVSDEQLREVFERAGDGIFITDAEGRLIDANDAACAMTLYPRAELLAKSVWELIDHGQHGALADARSRDGSIGYWKIRRKDGAMLDAEVSSRRLSDGRRIGVARDISLRRRAEQAEKQALTDLVSTHKARASDAERLVAGVVDYALFMLSPDGLVTNWNVGAERIKGYRADEIVGRHISTFYTDADRAEDRPGVALRTAAEQGRYEAEGWRVRKDGTLFWANVVLDAIRDEDGALVGFAKITRDITERREAQLELQRANERLAHAQKLEALGQLTGGVAHDFNNLLMVMAGQAELLRGRIGEDARAARSLDAILAATRRGQDLTRHLLAFGRRQRLNPAPVSLAERASELRTLLSSSLGSSVTVTVDYPEDLWTVEVDANEWELAMLNMAVNARDAMPSGGALSITARNLVLPDPEVGEDLRGEFVELTISDTGVGIPADILPRVLDPFFTTKEVSKGTGLGLSQVYGFVQQSGGRVSLRSELGQGTTIAIYLPRTLAPAAARRAPPPVEATGALEVLCVEDNPEVADVAAGLLERLGHSVRIATSSAAAVGLLEGGYRPDVVFSDIVMAGEMDGLGLARHIRRRWPRIPILLATGYSREAEAIGDEFPILAKPYQLGDLSKALSAVGAGP